MGDDLEPISPEEAFELWMDRQEARKAEETLDSYRYRVSSFIEWLEGEGITNLNDLTGRDLLRFDADRQERDVQQNTLKNQFGTIRLFLKFCEDIEAVEEGLSKKMDPPHVPKDERVNREKLPSERAETLLENLNRFKYASRDHVIVLLMWRTTARLGAVRALDIEDVYLEEEHLDRFRYRDDMNVEGPVVEKILEGVEVPFVYFRHRPPETPLKNGAGGERPVNISEDVGRVLRDYINVNREEVTDDTDRRALLTTSKGATARMSKSGMRNRVYRLTQPCRFGGDCPHDRVIEECEARYAGKESQCPSSRSPHRIRTGSITWHRDRGWPPEVLSEKANTSVQMIQDVYDQPEALKRMASRRSFLSDLEDDL